MQKDLFYSNTGRTATLSLYIMYCTGKMSM